MDLSKLTDEPEITITIGGRDYQFSELPIAALARLQEWIKGEHPHPIEAIKPHLDGLGPEDRRYLLDQARLEARSWPPEIGTPEGAEALLRSSKGQLEAFHVGLLVHQPETTPEQAQAIFRQLQKEARKKGGEAKVKRIYRTIFGTEEPEEEEGGNGAPKAPRGGAGVPWEKLFRAAEQRLRMRKWEIVRYTLSQLLNALDFSDPDDPHSGQMVIGSLNELDDMI